VEYRYFYKLINDYLSGEFLAVFFAVIQIDATWV